MNDSKTPVYIRFITAINRGNAAPVEKHETHLKGDLFYKNNYYYLIYSETIENIGNINTTLKFQDKEAIIIRKGAISMRQKLIPGKETSGIYKHPMGFMEMKTNATKVSFKYDSTLGNGELRLEYRMELQGQAAGKYKLLFNIKEVPYDHR